MSESTQPSDSTLLHTVLLTAIYVAFARLGLAMDAVGGFATLVWAPAGIAVAAFLVLGRRVWPGIALGSFVANVLSGARAPVAVVIAGGNILEALVAAVVLERLV